MSYMQIATKHMSKSTGPLQTDQTDKKAPPAAMLKKKVSKALPPVTKPSTLATTAKPGTPFGSLSNLLKK